MIESNNSPKHRSLFRIPLSARGHEGGRVQNFKIGILNNFFLFKRETTLQKTNICSGFSSLLEGMKEEGCKPVRAHIVASHHLYQDNKFGLRCYLELFRSKTSDSNFERQRGDFITWSILARTWMSATCRMNTSIEQDNKIHCRTKFHQQKYNFATLEC